VQLHHGGLRAVHELTGTAPIGSWDELDKGGRAMSNGEVQRVIEDFIVAGLRAERAGFSGVELHGAHGYLLCQFLDSRRNQRSNQYGGSFDNRARALLEVVSGLRARAGKDFQIGVRLSPESHGVLLAAARLLAERFMQAGEVDYIDMSLWDVFKLPVEAGEPQQPLLDHFTQLSHGACRLGAAGKLSSGTTASECLLHGADFVLLGRAAILQRDFPEQVRRNPEFACVTPPVTRDYLREQGWGRCSSTI
jgi:2,4-dienoyl-CoA reductase-like NADH-dependent reductase (Old Yellow Enzyme family)